MTSLHRRVPTAVLLVCVCASGAAASQAILPRAGGGAGAHSASGPVHDDQLALSDAIAGPLVRALSEQFGNRAVDMWLEAIAVQDLDARASAISGTGGVLVDGGSDKVGFRFHVPYDNRRRRAGYPAVSIGGVAAGERDLPNDGRLIRHLESDMAKALARRFRKPSTWLRLDAIATVEGGNRFLRINAEGMAYVDRNDPGAPVVLQAIYDRIGNAWVRIEYELGGGSHSPAAASSTAVR